jgi:hypothetical protein
MVTIVKHEWHQVDSQFAYEIDEDMLSEIYPDLSEEEIAQMLVDLEQGNIDVEQLVQDAWDNDIYFDWERQYDDWWTDRKGGYDITYEIGDENSWHHEPAPAEPTHKCTNCKWIGQSYDAEWSWTDKQGNEIDESRKICPYCESDVELTEHGIQEEKEKNERYAKIEKELNEIKLEDNDDES